MDMRRGENKRESWWVRNNTNQTITIGDLLLFPALKPGKREDLLHYYSREKAGHSKILVKLVKAGIVSLNKDKIYTNNYPGEITAADIDEAITPAEENEIDDALRDELGDFLGMSVVTEVGDPGTDTNLVTEQGIRESLIDEITEGEIITDDTGGILIHGKDPEDDAQPAGITGVENDELQIISIETEDTLDAIIKELKKINLQMAIITDIYLKDQDINSEGIHFFRNKEEAIDYKFDY